MAPLQALLGYLPQLTPETTPLLSNQRVENRGEEMDKRREQARAALAKTAQGTPIEQFKTGDQVWLKAKHLALPYQAPKLAPKHHGPFTITKQVSPVAYKLDLPLGWTILVLGKFGLVRFKPLLAKPQTKLLRISQTKLKLKPN
jgi:hypothetical protein